MNEMLKAFFKSGIPSFILISGLLAFSGTLLAGAKSLTAPGAIMGGIAGFAAIGMLLQAFFTRLVGEHYKGVIGSQQQSVRSQTQTITALNKEIRRGFSSTGTTTTETTKFIDSTPNRTKDS